MVEEKRRVDRTVHDLEIKITLLSPQGENVLAGPVDGKLKNISSYGAGLLLSQINVNNHHIFYATQDDPEKIVILEVEASEGKSLSIPVVPVWFNCDHSEEAMPFQLGVDFVPDPEAENIKRLIRLVRERKKSWGNWLSELLD